MDYPSRRRFHDRAPAGVGILSRNDRRSAPLMGRIVGTSTGWDQVDSWAIRLLDFEPNDLGKRFVPDFFGPRDLMIDWDSGNASVHDAAGNETLLRTDWSVFNREIEEPGWQVKKE